ncbi:protein of unknown function (DU1801) [Lutimaribacter saemankumensis]|uniref:YdhG-like domain-containing protein n=1 Tax=Lutimaribacter saemankumensis TaxID=490829 RepID=A0A1G8PGI0_9RHOB|nr:protein of unknown function (DU1801) [Lutimaribacter saemankumensis]
MPQTRFASDAVSSAFAGFAQPARAHLLRLREMILETASDTPAAGRIEETLKWGQPAYLTPETRSGSTLRLGVPKTGGYAIYAHCQTSLISDFRMLFPDDFAYDGNRAVLFDAETAPDLDKLRLLVSRALTYHLR